MAETSSVARNSGELAGYLKIAKFMLYKKLAQEGGR